MQLRVVALSAVQRKIDVNSEETKTIQWSETQVAAEQSEFDLQENES